MQQNAQGIEVSFPTLVGRYAPLMWPVEIARFHRDIFSFGQSFLRALTVAPSDRRIVFSRENDQRQSKCQRARGRKKRHPRHHPSPRMMRQDGHSQGWRRPRSSPTPKSLAVSSRVDVSVALWWRRRTTDFILDTRCFCSPAGARNTLSWVSTRVKPRVSSEVSTVLSSWSARTTVSREPSRFDLPAKGHFARIAGVSRRGLTSRGPPAHESSPRPQ